MKEGKCSFCGKPIIWLLSTKGKMTPCNPDMTLYFSSKRVRGSDKIVTKNGEIMQCSYTPPDDMDAVQAGMGYVPHWLTCPSR